MMQQTGFSQAQLARARQQAAATTYPPKPTSPRVVPPDLTPRLGMRSIREAPAEVRARAAQQSGDAGRQMPMPTVTPMPSMPPQAQRGVIDRGTGQTTWLPPVSPMPQPQPVPTPTVQSFRDWANQFVIDNPPPIPRAVMQSGGAQKWLLENPRGVATPKVLPAVTPQAWEFGERRFQRPLGPQPHSAYEALTAGMTGAPGWGLELQGPAASRFGTAADVVESAITPITKVLQGVFGGAKVPTPPSWWQRRPVSYGGYRTDRTPDMRPLNIHEQKVAQQLFGGWLDTNRVRILPRPGPAGFSGASDDLIILSAGDANNDLTLAHELVHVMQYQTGVPQDRNLVRRIQDDLTRLAAGLPLFRYGPYEYSISSGRSFFEYGTEQQAGILSEWYRNPAARSDPRYQQLIQEFWGGSQPPPVPSAGPYLPTFASEAVG